MLLSSMTSHSSMPRSPAFGRLTSLTMCAAASRPLFTLTPRAVKRLDTARKSLRGQPWVVIDGNNVMSALGRNQSLEHCTLEFDEWAHENGLGNRVLTVWDGGSEAPGRRRRKVVGWLVSIVEEDLALVGEESRRPLAL